MERAFKQNKLLDFLFRKDLAEAFWRTKLETFKIQLVEAQFTGLELGVLSSLYVVSITFRVVIWVYLKRLEPVQVNFIDQNFALNEQFCCSKLNCSYHVLARFYHLSLIFRKYLTSNQFAMMLCHWYSSTPMIFSLTQQNYQMFRMTLYLWVTNAQNR